MIKNIVDSCLDFEEGCPRVVLDGIIVQRNRNKGFDVSYG